MTGIDLAAQPALRSAYRLQWEAAQQAWVLLYPEGMVRLNGPAAEILRRCDGSTGVAALVSDLERAFGASNLRDDVCEFLSEAASRGWIEFAG
ncbi:MAG TPA: pyrroloquinoline quinone biosynthesis peptide chaperone PqqD [Casimicrobiaceae bacterium]|nr:pyrroloquinoline quinone biosynthesis peptide chaperone PqqD [Casimicrobiaceae bacterium]